MRRRLNKDIILESVNHQIGWLNGIIRSLEAKRRRDNDLIEALGELRDSQERLLESVKTGEWGQVV